MISRVCRAGLAALALSLCASACLAQSESAPAAPVARTGMLPGRGSIGGQFGTSYVLAADDYSKGAQPRMSLAGHFRYVASGGLRWQVSPYFTWAAYRNTEAVPFADPQFPQDATKDHFLTLVTGGNAQLQWLAGKGSWRWHLGAGPAVYRVVVENRRKVLEDPATRRRHQGTYLGATGEVGVERFTKGLPNTSIELTLAGQQVFSSRSEQFPSGFDGGISAAELRLGAHYYYDFKKAKKPDALPKSTP